MQQDPKKKNNAKKKPKLVYKPYKKGIVFSAYTVKKGVGLMAYFLLFAILYFLLGATLNFENDILRIGANVILVLTCCALTYVSGARLGQEEVGAGEIAYAREQAGKTVDRGDTVKCYHPWKGVVICLVAILPVLLITVPYAVLAKKQVYELQLLPSWVDAYASQSAIHEPLRYYENGYTVGLVDYLRIVTRIMILPFANMATPDRADLLLIVDRLSPLLACLPAVGYPLGYLSGPRSRAMVHGDIALGVRRARQKQKKAIKARREQREKKNELI